MTASEGEQRAVKPVYLSGVLTVEAELSAGRLYDGSTHAENASRVAGAAMLFTEDKSGQITRLRIPGPGFLRLTDDAEGKLARSRQQPDSRPSDRGADQLRRVPPRARPGGTATGATSPGNTAEPSRELSVGDIVAVGEAGLAVGRVGWTLVPGGLNEVHTSKHGTRPLPPPTLGGATPGGPSPIPRKEPDRL